MGVAGYSASDSPVANSLFIGVPTQGDLPPEFGFDSGWPLSFHIGRNHPEIEKVWFRRETGTYRHIAREAICELALQLGAEWVLMIDSDQVFDPEDFDAIWAVRDPEKVIMGIYFFRDVPTGPCVFQAHEGSSRPLPTLPPEMLFEADYVGYGFILIPVPVIAKLNKPRFWLNFGYGEDVAFGYRCQQVGVPLMVHQGVNVRHLGQRPQIGWKEWREQGERTPESKVATPKLVPINPEDGIKMDAFPAPGASRVRWASLRKGQSRSYKGAQRSNGGQGEEGPKEAPQGATHEETEAS